MSDAPNVPPGWEDDDEPAQANAAQAGKLTPETPIPEALDRYLAVNTRVRSRRTVVSYLTVTRLFASHMGCVPTVSMLTDDNLASFFSAREKAVSRSTVNGEAATLLAFVKWCFRKRLIEWPDVKPPERVRRRPRALTQAQLRDLFTAAQYYRGDVVKGVPGTVFWFALLSILWQTGERIGAVLQLGWGQIDLETGFITYPPETRKFGQDELIRPINDQAVKALRELKEYSPEQPFALPLHGQFYAKWHQLRAMAGLPEGTTPHDVRKAVASHLPTLEDARRMLGHSNAAITARNYRDDRLANDRELLDKLPDVTKPESRKAGSWRTMLFGGSAN